MNKFLTSSLTFLLLFSFSAIIAQRVCGTSVQTQYDARERLFQNRINAANQETAASRDVTVYVPIKFHIVAKSNGSFGIKEAQVLSLLCGINNEYADQEMVFYINYPFNYINNDALYDDPTSNGALFQIDNNWVSSSINIFLTNTAGGSATGSGTLAYYLGPAQGFSKEHIVCRKNDADGPTVGHELGHFFSLPHPFFGWEDNPWNTGDQNPVGTWAPSVGFQNPVLNEKMDQSNCLQAADGICDTPPDYLFAFSNAQNGCNPWNGGAMDPNGDICDPMENNIMSYFSPCADYIFTQDQKDAIRNDFNSRPSIQHAYVPHIEDITAAPELVEPIDNEETSGFNIIFFDWEPADGAHYYLLEIDQQATFNFLPKRYTIANGSSIELQGIFNANVTYYWRVTPFNDGNTCNLPTSPTESFKAGESVSTKNIESVNNWSVIPNPVRQNEILNIQVDADEAFNADIRLFSMTGQLIKSINKHRFTIGESNFNLDISGANTGMYIVAVQSDKGVINKKIVITE